ncbi:MAG: hypothetical protein C0506_09795 [Anaerolinea sp.]|nr:hypothetical protein [Anaerolinea sp.]
MSEGSMGFEQELLTSAAEGFPYPETPDLRAGVRLRLAVPQAGTGQPWLRRGLAAAIVAVVAVLITVSVSREARDAVADFLGLAVEGEQVRILPTPAPGVTATPFPSPQPLETYATPTTLLGARSLLEFEPRLPAGQGEPRGVYTIQYIGVNVLVLDYERFALWEFRDLAAEKGVVDKSVGGVFDGATADKMVERVDATTVSGRPAYWISGGPHFVRFIGPDGTPVAGSARTVERDTLIWRGASGTNYRLEIEGTLDEALAIATTLP